MRLAVLILLAIAELPAGGQPPRVGVHAGGQQPQQVQNNAATPKADQRGTVSQPLIVKTAPKDDKESAEEQRDKDTKEFFDRWTFRLAIAVTIAALLQVVGIVFQVLLFNKQTNIMEGSLVAASDAAEAAKLNAQAVINAERAWLVVSIQKDPSPHPFPAENFINVMTNEGRTPAVLKSIHFQHEFISLPENLPVPPVYSGLVRMPEQTFMVGAKELPIGTGFDPKKIIYMRGKDARTQTALEFLVCYGRIIYEDVFEINGKGRPRESHETRWCYAWSIGEKRYVCCGPEEYNRNT